MKFQAYAEARMAKNTPGKAFSTALKAARNRANKTWRTKYYNKRENNYNCKDGYMRLPAGQTGKYDTIWTPRCVKTEEKRADMRWIMREAKALRARGETPQRALAQAWASFKAGGQFA